jgi:hypothetical protein
MDGPVHASKGRPAYIFRCFRAMSLGVAMPSASRPRPSSIWRDTAIPAGHRKMGVCGPERRREEMLSEGIIPKGCCPSRAKDDDVRATCPALRNWSSRPLVTTIRSRNRCPSLGSDASPPHTDGASRSLQTERLASEASKVDGSVAIAVMSRAAFTTFPLPDFQTLAAFGAADTRHRHRLPSGVPRRGPAPWRPAGRVLRLDPETDGRTACSSASTVRIPPSTAAGSSCATTAPRRRPRPTYSAGTASARAAAHRDRRCAMLPACSPSCTAGMCRRDFRIPSGAARLPPRRGLRPRRDHRHRSRRRAGG